MTMNYTLIAYKPDSDDYCMGCEMARYRSDHRVICSEDPAAIALAWAEVETTKLAHGEAGYECTLLLNGEEVTFFGDHPETEWIAAYMRVLSDEIRAQAAAREAEQKAQDAAQKLAAAQARERAQLAELLGKHHPDLVKHLKEGP